MGSTKSLSYSIKINVDGKDINISTDSLRDLKRAMDDAKGGAERLQDQLFRFNTAINTFQYAADGIRQIADVLNSLTDESRSFDAAMKAANTMAGKGSAGFEDLKDRVSELAKEIPLARDELANGLYQVISNGVPEDNWIDYLRASSRSAVGGIADVGEVVKVTSTIIKNYGLEWSAAQDIQDKIQLTAKNGVTSFEQLAAALPSVTGQAAQLGVSFTEMLAVMSTLTGVTGNTSEVSTQLASVLTALTKESSKSQKMAEEMGISFNAASIKAAGGFRNFLQELDRSVTAYAQKTGRLKESIYSQLFGRAEASRLISALTGNLSEKFSENIAALEQSVGTVDASFGDMASTGAAQLQLLKNEFAGFGDFIQDTIGGILPILNFGSQLGMSLIAIGGLSKAFTLLSAKMSGTAIAQTLVTLRNRIMASSFMQAAMAANGLQRTLMLLTAAGGIAAGIMLLVSAINALSGSSDAASVAAEALQEAEVQGAQAAQQKRDEIGKELEKLNDLIDKHEESAEMVSHLNNTYGDIFGTYATVAQWQKVLSNNEEIYCRLIAKETALQAINAKVAEQMVKVEQRRAWMKHYEENASGVQKFAMWLHGGKSILDDALSEDEATLTSLQEVAANLLKDTKAIRDQIQTGIEGIQNDVKKNGEIPVYDFKKMNLNELEKTRDHLEKMWKNATPGSKEEKAYKNLYEQAYRLYEIRSKIKKTESDKSKTKHTREQRTEYEKLGEQIKKYEDLAAKPDANIEKYHKEIDALKQRRKEIEATMRELGRPLEIRSIQDASDELDYLQAALKSVEDPNRRKELAAEVNEAQTLIEKMELATHMEVSIADIKDLRTLQQEEQYYQRMYDLATSDEERLAIAAKQKALSDLRAEMERASRIPPAGIDQLNTLKDLQEALQYYTQLQQEQSGEELAGTTAIIAKLNAKANALQRVTRLQEMQDELSSFVTGTMTAKIELKAVGLDGIKDRLRELQAMLDDMNNPPTEQQRKDILQTMDTYRQYQKQLLKSFDTYRKGWDNLKGVGNGIQSLTDALEGNGNAWQKLTSIIDACLSVYDGIKQVVAFVNMLTEATRIQTLTQEGETVAKLADTAATGAHTAATMADTAASKAQSAANASEAITSATKEGAKKPWPASLVAIATGVAAVVAALAMVGSFSEGGVVGGSSPTGDRLYARVNSGEMILNRRQQENMLRILSGRAAIGAGLNYGSLRGAMDGSPVRLEFKLRGDTLIATADRAQLRRMRS